MLKKHKNGFIEILNKYGLRPEQFSVEEETLHDTSTFTITLRSNNNLLFWAIHPASNFNQFACNFTTFSPTYSENGLLPRNNGWFKDILNVYGFFEYWLISHVKIFMEEMRTNDLWNLTIDEDNSNNFDDDTTTEFSETERDLIKLKITDFRNQIVAEYSPTEEQLAVIDKRLLYLTEAVDRLNKFDWRSVLVSTLLSIMTTLTLDKATGNTLFSLAKQYFAEGIQLLVSLK